MTLLPTEWVETTLDNIANWGSGGTPSRKNEDYYGGDIPWFKTGDLGNKVIKNPSEFITALGLKKSSAKLFPKGSVAIAMYGATIGKTSIFGIDATTNQACAVGYPKPNITTSEFLYYLLLNEKDNFISKGKGGAQPNISQALIKEHVVYLPPVAEQKEIVDRLDTLLAQVEATQARLAHIPDIIKRFRQSVLAAAVSGKLTEEWRNISRGNKKTSKTEILDARRLAWERFEFKRLADNGKFPANEKWKQKYKEPNEVLFDNVFDIPETWAWSNLSELSWSVKDGPHYSPKYTESGVPFISGGNISPSGIDFSNCKYISHELHEELSKRCKPDIGDILYTKGGTTGVAYFNTEERDFNVWVHVAVLKITPITNGFYLQYALNSQHCYGQSQNYTHGVGNQDLGLTRMVNITIPVPPIDEQTEIVRRVEQLFTYADTLEQQAKAAKERVDKLTQAILAKAFRGELTADWRAANPDLISGDNSAEALLARIQAERATAKPRKRASKPAISPTSSGVTQ